MKLRNPIQSPQKPDVPLKKKLPFSLAVTMRERPERIGGKVIDNRFEKMTGIKTQSVFDLEVYQQNQMIVKQNDKVIELLERIDSKLGGDK